MALPIKQLEIPNSVAVRFWNKVQKTDSCWIWKGGRNGDGYGLFWLDGVDVFAHRVAWMIDGNPNPGVADILHKCDNPPCVRPDHLFKGDQGINAKDMWEKGRGSKPPHRFGESNHKAVLTDIQVEEIRSDQITHQRELAKRYRCSQSTIWRIRHGKVRSKIILK